MNACRLDNRAMRAANMAGNGDQAVGMPGTARKTAARNHQAAGTLRLARPSACAIPQGKPKEPFGHSTRGSRRPITPSADPAAQMAFGWQSPTTLLARKSNAGDASLREKMERRPWIGLRSLRPPAQILLCKALERPRVASLASKTRGLPPCDSPSGPREARNAGLSNAGC